MRLDVQLVRSVESLEMMGSEANIGHVPQQICQQKRYSESWSFCDMPPAYLILKICSRFERTTTKSGKDFALPLANRGTWAKYELLQWVMPTGGCF